jgi:hypothetical protein
VPLTSGLMARLLGFSDVMWGLFMNRFGAIHEEGVIVLDGAQSTWH